MNLPVVAFQDEAPAVADFRAAVLAGLAQESRAIPPKFFYDRRGFALFERICELPEYYLTRTETAILRENANEVARLIGPQSVIIEPGCGAARKICVLLEQLRPAAYLGIDISRDGLLAATRRLAADYPWLRVHAACADLGGPLSHLRVPAGRHVAFYPGSSIGNFDPDEATQLLGRMRALVGPEGMLLIGVDLEKDPAVLHAAYNDAAGVTARFNLNLLDRMRRELDAVVDADGFAHRAFFAADTGRIEMHLVSCRRQQIRIDGRCFDFAPGETIHTENSYKYGIELFEQLAHAGGFATRALWTDRRQFFAVFLLRAI